MKNNIFKLGYKVFAFVIILGFMIASYVLFMVHKDWGPNNTNNIPFAYGEFTQSFLSFFTTQSNLIVAFFFLLAAIFHKREETFILTGQKAKIFVAGYISVTCTVWLTVLLPVMISQGGATALGWTLAVEPHIVAPALMIIYALTNVGLNKIDFKSYCKKDIWIYISYPIAYIVYVMIRGEMRWNDGKGGLSYPYPFLNVHETVFGMPGPVTFVIFFILILTIFFAYNLLYVYVNNLKVKHTSAQQNSNRNSNQNN